MEYRVALPRRVLRAVIWVTPTWSGLESSEAKGKIVPLAERRDES